MSTHYIPPFTRRVRGQELSACGEWVTAGTAEPTCPQCLAYLTQQANEDEETKRALEAEFPDLRGRL
jgi:hypothetical protein